MSDFLDGLAGRVKTDYDPKHQNLPVTEADVTQVSASSPHWIRCAIRRNPVREEIAEGKTSLIEMANWLVGPFPTRDAADSHCQEVRHAMRHIVGEPEQAWSEVAKMTRCPNPGLLPKFKDLDMTLVVAQPPKSEPIPHDHPAFNDPSFAARHAKRDAVTGLPHPVPGPAAPAGTGKEREGPKRKRAAPVRKPAKAAAGPVQGGRGGRKAGNRSSKQGAAKKGNR